MCECNAIYTVTSNFEAEAMGQSYSRYGVVMIVAVGAADWIEKKNVAFTLHVSISF